jgi:metallo-beta-lactamase class B
MAMKHVILAFLLTLSATAALAAQEPAKTKVPAWDARGLGPLPRMGITSIDVSDDGKEIVVGTIAAFGDPNVIVLDDTGKIVRTYKVGQQWIDNVAFIAGSHEVLVICTMPAGKAGDRVEVFRCKGDEVIPGQIKQEGPWFFHYGDHSNHPTMKLARAKNATALLAGNQLIVYRKDKEPATIRVPVSDPDASVSLAVDEHGWAVVGATSRDREGAGHNLFLFDPDQKKPVWSRAANKDVEKAPALERGLYGTPTLPDGTRAELPQRDEKVWAPLSVAIHGDGAKKLIAVADYQGWQRWVRSSATMKDENQGLRFVPTKPTITVYDEAGQKRQALSAEKFDEAFWCVVEITGGPEIFVAPNRWKCRGLAGSTVLPTDGPAKAYRFDAATGKLRKAQFLDGWDLFSASHRESKKFYMAELFGTVEVIDEGGAIIDFSKPEWKINLNKLVPKSPKPWVANARATPIVDGVWQIPGGRVESDLGGQRLIEAPDGYILIEGHAGLSFEREWASMVAVGLDPMKIKYVLATHEHGDHAPGAYLWRVVTGAKFVCSEEMAYTLQHHIPGNTGYGLHPPVPTDIVIKKDQELDLAGLKVRAIRIPGHTYGSMAWHFEKGGKTFVAFGDLIMPKGVLGYSGSVNFSATDALASLRKLRDLKPDYVLPGHGAVEGPANYLQAGVDVGTAVGWGFIKPERPDPRFRITQKNVVVVGWGQQATSAAFGDVNGDGKPDVVMVAPDGDASVVMVFLNHDGKFNDKPDHRIKLLSVSEPHKIRIVETKDGPVILVAGKRADLFLPVDPPKNGSLPLFVISHLKFADGNQVRLLPDTSVLISRRFGGFYGPCDFLRDLPGEKFVPEIDGPYVDFRFIGNDLLTSYGKLYRKDKGGKFGKKPLMELPREKDWQFLAVGDFNGDKVPDAAFLSYGMEKSTSARMFYGRAKAELPFAEKADATIDLSALLKTAKKGNAPPLVRDTPVVADWNGDGIDDLIVAHGQSDEILILLGGKDGLSKERVQRIQLEYRVHYEHGVFVGDFNGDGKADLAVFGYTNTGVGASGPPAVYLWLQ